MKIDLKGVSETLLLPLYARAIAHSLSIFEDQKSFDLYNSIDYDFDALRGKTGDSIVYCIARSIHFDQEIKAFLKKNPNGIIIDLGCGLDTGFYRNDNENVIWIDIDLIDVMLLKSKLLPRPERVNYIGSSIMDIEGYLNGNILNEKHLFIAGGLLLYFTEEKVKQLLTSLATKFPGAGLIFDCSPLWVIDFIQKYTELKGLENITFKWGLDNAKDLEKWSDKIKVKYQVPYFERLLQLENVPQDLKDNANRYSILNKSSIVHLEFVE